MCKPKDVLERKRTLRREVIARRRRHPRREKAYKIQMHLPAIAEEFNRVCTTKAHPTVAVYAAMNSEVDLKDFIDAPTDAAHAWPSPA